MSKPIPDAHLYGLDRPKKKATHKEISSSTTVAFTSQLSSLLQSSSARSSAPSRGRPRSSAPKDSIFTTHNKNTKKRALADLQDVSSPNHSHSSHNLDAPDLHRSKRKMQEKARLYAAMKRGDYVPGENEAESLIDFDRKWAETEARGDLLSDQSSSDNDSDDDGRHEVIEYEDEYGRLRTGTRADKERIERKKRNAVLGQEELDRMSARPVQPANVIYGPTVQHAAFNPDEETTARMEELAQKRDRSATPPEATHYEADKEMRRRGTGFFAFEKDEAGRRRQLEGLEAERRETERVRASREMGKNKRREEIEARKREIAGARAKKQADAFLESFVPETANFQGDDN